MVQGSNPCTGAMNEARDEVVRVLEGKLKRGESIFIVSRLIDEIYADYYRSRFAQRLTDLVFSDDEHSLNAD